MLSFGSWEWHCLDYLYLCDLHRTVALSFRANTEGLHSSVG